MLKKIFTSKVFQITVVNLIFLVIPVSLVDWQLLLTWQIIVLFLLSSSLMITSPRIASLDEAKKDQSKDRSSVHLITMAVMLSYMIPIVDSVVLRTELPAIDETMTWIGVCLMFGGMILRAYSVRHLGNFFSATVTIKEDHQLISSGPYHYLRHPSYTGAFFSLLGVSVFLRSTWGALFCAAVFLPIYYYRIHFEEKALSENFGQKYVDYKKKTWAIIPFLY